MATFSPLALAGEIRRVARIDRVASPLAIARQRFVLLSVSAGVKLTHCAEVKVTHLGEDGGFLGRRHVDPGAGSGDSDIGPARRVDSADQSADGAVA